VCRVEADGRRPPPEASGTAMWRDV
jgi:hypothetical protein